MLVRVCETVIMEDFLMTIEFSFCTSKHTLVNLRDQNESVHTVKIPTSMSTIGTCTSKTIRVGVSKPPTDTLKE